MALNSNWDNENVICFPEEEAVPDFLRSTSSLFSVDKVKKASGRGEWASYDQLDSFII